MINIVLVEPENPGNIGAIARAMANFGLNNLYIINPKVYPITGEALARAKHGKDILKDYTLITFKELDKFDLIIGTTGKLGSKHNLNRLPLAPSELSAVINKKGNIAILFGRESKGLYNYELDKCDLVVNIPTSQEYPILNISHAAVILFYEIFKTGFNPCFELPRAEEKSHIIKKINNIIDQLNFKNPINQKKFWRKFISKSLITRSEAYMLFGFLKKLEEKINQSDQ